MPNDTFKGAIIITGCSSGIGYFCAHALKKRGYLVLATARKAEDVRRLQTEGLLCHLLDVDSVSSIEKALQWAIEQSDNRLNMLFNNAGYGLLAAVEDMSFEALQAQFSTNVIGPQVLTNRFIAHLRKHHNATGRIVYNSSVLGYVSIRFRGAYSATKYAMEGFADSLRLELVDTNIKTVLIEPGPITSAFRINAYKAFKKWIDPEKSAYAAIYQRQIQRHADPNKLPVLPFNLEPIAVYKALLHALEKTNPKPRYLVTFPSHLFWWFRRLLSTRRLDAILKKI